MKPIKDTNPLTNPFHSMEDKDWVERVEQRYEYEDALRSVVMRGDTERALALWQQSMGERGSMSAVQDFGYLIRGDLLEFLRRNCRICNVTLRVAARLGGLQPLYLHNISEKFGIIIGNTTDLQYLEHQLIPDMIREYCEAVAHFSVSGYSKLINGAVQYISRNILEKIELGEMAAVLYVSREHLSRRFRQETGKSIPDYVNCQRIEMAKMLLKDGRADITEIALHLGYRDSSYFSKVFKRVTGVSPRVYAAR